MKVILDGKSLADQMVGELMALNAEKKANLSVILVGNKADSVKYVKMKQRRACEVGVECDIVTLLENIPEDELLEKIDALNADLAVDGIMVQLPLPEHINIMRIVERINPEKDVDGLNPKSGIMPATVRGIEKLLEHYLFGHDFDLNGKVAVVVGQGPTVGKPAAKMLASHGAAMVTCDINTPDLKAETQKADILVVAAGVPNLIGADMVKDGVVIIDSGAINPGVDPACYSKAAAYTPVPGGVGPMTVISLLENVIRMSK